MKIKKIVEVEKEIEICNICKKDIEDNYVESFDEMKKKRIEVVRFLFKTENFDAHKRCINKVIRESFEKYIDPKPLKE